jgi:hypothetical protein
MGRPCRRNVTFTVDGNIHHTSATSEHQEWLAAVDDFLQHCVQCNDSGSAGGEDLSVFVGHYQRHVSRQAFTEALKFRQIR